MDGPSPNRSPRWSRRVDPSLQARNNNSDNAKSNQNNNNNTDSAIAKSNAPLLKQDLKLPSQVLTERNCIDVDVAKRTCSADTAYLAQDSAAEGLDDGLPVLRQKEKVQVSTIDKNSSDDKQKSAGDAVLVGSLGIRNVGGAAVHSSRSFRRSLSQSDEFLRNLRVRDAAQRASVAFPSRTSIDRPPVESPSHTGLRSVDAERTLPGPTRHSSLSKSGVHYDQVSISAPVLSRKELDRPLSSHSGSTDGAQATRPSVSASDGAVQERQSSIRTEEGLNSSPQVQKCGTSPTLVQARAQRAVAELTAEVVRPHIVTRTSTVPVSSARFTRDDNLSEVDTNGETPEKFKTPTRRNFRRANSAYVDSPSKPPDKSGFADLAAISARSSLCMPPTRSRTEPQSRVDLHDCTWNDAFQNCLEELRKAMKHNSDSADVERLRRELDNIVEDFEFSARTYSQIIISELGLPIERKTVKPVARGGPGSGFAGGEKFIVDSIVFKVAVDSAQLFSGDTFVGRPGSSAGAAAAAKVAGNDLRGLNIYFAAAHPDGLPNECDLSFPLCCVIDYRGFRCIALARVPIEEATLVYGSTDGGLSVNLRDDVTIRSFQIIAERLNLKPHAVRCGPLVRDIYSAVDVEGHIGHDNRRYALDFGRALPPEAPPDPYLPGSRLQRLMRPELVKSWSKPLNPDVFAPAVSLVGVSGDWSVDVDHIDAEAATSHLLQAVVPRFASDILCAGESDHLSAGSVEELSLAAQGTMMTNPSWLCSLAHRNGINIRHLGRIRSCTFGQDSVAAQNLRAQLLLEMVARVVKSECRRRMRALILARKAALSWPDRDPLQSDFNQYEVLAQSDGDGSWLRMSTQSSTSLAVMDAVRSAPSVFVSAAYRGLSLQSSKEVVVDLLNVVLELATDADELSSPNYFWETVVKGLIVDKFGQHALDRAEYRPEFDMRDGLKSFCNTSFSGNNECRWRRMLLDKVSAAVGIRWRRSAFVGGYVHREQYQVPLCLTCPCTISASQTNIEKPLHSRPLNVVDMKELRAVTKHMTSVGSWTVSTDPHRGMFGGSPTSIAQASVPQVDQFRVVLSRMTPGDARHALTSGTSIPSVMLVQLGQMYEDNGDNLSAEDCYRGVIAQQPRHIFAVYKLAKLLVRTDDPQRREEAVELLAFGLDAAKASFESLSDMQRKSEPGCLHDRLHALFDLRLNLLLEYADILLASKDTAAESTAAVCLDEALALFCGCSGLCCVARVADSDDISEPPAETLRCRGSADPVVCHNHGLFLVTRRNETAAADTWLTRALQLDPNNSHHLGTYAWFCMSVLRNPDLAAHWLERARDVR